MKKILKLILVVFLINAHSLPVFAVEKDDSQYINDPYSDSINDPYADSIGYYQVDSLNIYNNTSSPYQLVPSIGEAGGYTSTDNNWVYKNSGNLNYNCYLYAIGKTSGAKRNPGYYSTGEITSMKNASITTIIAAVISDLKSLGYSNARSVPYDYTTASGETLIAFRKGYNANGYYQDYHFMKYDRNYGYWFHKPGLTAILIYKNNARSGVWPAEAYDDGWVSSWFDYNGTVSYIVY